MDHPRVPALGLSDTFLPFAGLPRWIHGLRLPARSDLDSSVAPIPLPLSGASRAGGFRLFVLVDALGWEILRLAPFLDDWLPYRRPLRTILGFSSGAIPTILTGKPPESHGHWNLLYFDPAESPFRWLRPLRHAPGLDSRLGRKALQILGRRWLGLGPGFECVVAPKLLPWFNWCERRNLYAPGGIEGAHGVFDQWREAGLRAAILSYHQLGRGAGDGGDYELIRRAGAAIASGVEVVFLYLSELDHWLHFHRRDAAAIRDKLGDYDRRLSHLFQRARRRDPDAQLAVFSDHGMAPVAEREDLAGTVLAALRARRLRSPRDYLAVYDSTMARFWCFSARARRALEQVLRAQSCGRVLERAELQREGVFFPDQRYGQIIFLLHPRRLIARGDFNGRGWNPLGMHGYHPEDPDSAAVLLTNFAPPGSVRTIADLYGLLAAPLPAARPAGVPA